MNEAAHVIVVDDDPDFRRAMVRLLDAEHYTTSAFESAEHCLNAYPCVDAAALQCLILDVRMPGMGGLAMQSQLLAYGIDSPVIMITGAADIALAVKAMRAGAVNVVQKPVAGPEMLNAVQQALAADERYRHVRMLRASLQHRLKLLTERERQTLQLMLDGKNNKAVAREFDVSIQTAAKHTARVLKKMAAADPFDLFASFLKLECLGPSHQPSAGCRHDHAGG
jgi:FixJ family two-component response regulator